MQELWLKLDVMKRSACLIIWIKNKDFVQRIGDFSNLFITYSAILEINLNGLDNFPCQVEMLLPADFIPSVYFKSMPVTL